MSAGECREKGEKNKWLKMEIGEKGVGFSDGIQ